MDIWELDACGQADLVARGEIGPNQAVEAAVTRAEALPALNAIIWPLYENVSDPAPALGDARFRGVPFAMKDLGATQAGQPYAMGNRALRDLGHRAPADTTLGSRFRTAGLVTIGKTNLPEFGLQSTTQPLAFGPTCNPWDLTRSTSGSSGGSAAAVAAGIVPAAHGNDGSGSLRMPAAWCGLVGLKPSRGRVPSAPGLATTRTDVEFVLCRTVRDAAALLDEVGGSAPGDLFQAPAPARPYMQEVTDAPNRLRVALLTSVPDMVTHPACIEAVQATGRLLEELGHDVIDDKTPAAFAQRGDDPMLGIFEVVAHARTTVAALTDLLGREVGEADIEPFLWDIVNAPFPSSAVDFIRAAEVTQEWAWAASRWWDTSGVDVLVTPTVWEPPCLLADMSADALDSLTLGTKVAQHCAFTEPFNITGEPAISLPLHWTGDGLPVGVQLAAPFGREDQLLRLAGQLESTRPWLTRWRNMAASLGTT